MKLAWQMAQPINVIQTTDSSAASKILTGRDETAPGIRGPDHGGSARCTEHKK